MKRLMIPTAVLAVAVLLAGCAGGAKSGGPVATGTGPAVTSPEPTTGPTTAPPTTVSPTTPPTTSPEPTSPPLTTAPPSTPSPTGTVTLEVWFDSPSGGTMARAFRTVPATQAVGTAALTALLDGPTANEVARGIGTQIPPGTELLGLSISNGVATVNLSTDYFSGGSAVSEWTRLGQVVWTIGQFGSVHGATIELAGDPIKPFDIGGNALDRPWTRADFEQIAPPIVVDTPAAGQTVSSPIHVTGTADVFEAVVSFRLLDEHATEIAKGTTMATCGTGCRGTFDTKLAYTVGHDQRGTLEVFEVSAKDGSPVSLVRVPVRLTQ